MTFDDIKGMDLAYEEALKGFNEGGVPIGSVLIHKDGTVISRGHNMRVQKNSMTLHAEISCLEATNRVPASITKNCTLYSTLSPCSMCTGSALLFKIPRVVIGENETFMGAEDWLAKNNVEVINLKDARCKDLMDKFIAKHPEIWNEDIGE
ncbi:cytosine deaminase [Pichia kluyveri]|uniref:Cytosine deaminase n=1 Tax=Pichia kluyveri TaxID=36015 RepID=A0AAV5QY35_PICKL|nr:cytosine deaminase [Pichia kluyveri]